MKTQTYMMFREAILERKQVTCSYNGLHRELCPHVIGDGKDGNPKVLSFQFAGQTSQGQLPPQGEWRCMAIKDIQNVELRIGSWHTGDSHKRPQTCVKRIDVKAGG